VPLTLNKSTSNTEHYDSIQQLRSKSLYTFNRNKSIESEYRGTAPSLDSLKFKGLKSYPIRNDPKVKIGIPLYPKTQNLPNSS